MGGGLYSCSHPFAGFPFSPFSSSSLRVLFFFVGWFFNENEGVLFATTRARLRAVRCTSILFSCSLTLGHWAALCCTHTRVTCGVRHTFGACPLCCVDRCPKPVWTQSFGLSNRSFTWTESSAAVDADGRVFVGSGSSLWAVNLTDGQVYYCKRFRTDRLSLILYSRKLLTHFTSLVLVFAVNTH